MENIIAYLVIRFPETTTFSVEYSKSIIRTISLRPILAKYADTYADQVAIAHSDAM